MKFVLPFLLASFVSTAHAKTPCAKPVLISQDIALTELDSRRPDDRRDIQAADAALKHLGYRTVIADRSSIGGTADEQGEELGVNFAKKAGRVVADESIEIHYKGKSPAKASAAARSGAPYRITAGTYLISETNDAEIYPVLLEKGDCADPESDGNEFSVSCKQKVLAVGPMLGVSREHATNQMSIDGMHQEEDDVTERAPGNPMGDFIASLGACSR